MKRALTDSLARAAALRACADEIYAAIGGSENIERVVAATGGNDWDLIPVVRQMEQIRDELLRRAEAIEQRAQQKAGR